MEKVTVIYNGYKFHRYPNAKGISDQRYFKGWVEINSEWRKTYLHRYMWVIEKGEIPKGYHIHHKDGNFLNNTIDNFECISSKDHISNHYHEQSDAWKSQKTSILINVARAKAVDWHKSEAGREWHKTNFFKHSAKALFTEKTKRCEHCSKEYKTIASHGGTRFCSNNCKSSSRKRSGVDNIERMCAFCGCSYDVNKYSKGKTCSRICSWELRRMFAA
jgi:hypothetical protein